MSQRTELRQCDRMPRIEVKRVEVGLPSRGIVAVREQPASLEQRAVDHVRRFWKNSRWCPGGQSSNVPYRENPIFS